MKKALAMQAGILLALAPMTGATPIVAIRTPSGIVVGTNTTDDGGHPHCKLFTNSSVAIIRASNLTRYLPDGKVVVFDSGVGIWKAMEGNPDVDQVQERVVKSLEDSAAEFVRLRPSMSLAGQMRTKAEFVRRLDTHMLIVTSDKALVKMQAVYITFSGWPRPAATAAVESTPNDPKLPTTLFTWVGPDPQPQSEHTGFIEQGKILSIVQDRLAYIARQMKDDPAHRSFMPPFVTAYIGTSGVQWLSGDPDDRTACDQERQAALDQSPRQGHE